MKAIKLFILCCAFCLYLVYTKRTLLEGVYELDKADNLYPNFTFSLESLENSTYDGQLAQSYYWATNGFLQCVNHTCPHEDYNSTQIQEGFDHLNSFPKSKNMNRRAIKYFLFTQSLLINEIESPFGKEVPELAELNFDFQYYEDSEIQSHQKLNYLALLEFWKQYICILHQKSPKKVTQIHEEYMRLLVMIFPEDSKTQKHLKPFEWINNNCKCTLDKAAIFLNPAKKAYDFNLGNKGVPPLQPDISDTTDTDLKYDFYYTKGEILQAERVHQYRRDLQDGKNVTLKDEDLEEGSQIKINHTPATPVAGDLHPEGPAVDPAAGAGGDAPADVAQPGEVPAADPAQVAGPAPAAEAAGNEAPAAAAEGPAPPVDPMMNNGGMGNDPLNPAGVNPGMGNGGGGGFFRGWNPLGFLASSRFFGNLFKPKNENIAEDHPDLDEPLELKVLKDHAMKSNNSDEFLNIANIYMVGNSEVGIVQDSKKAWKYYQLAADLNNSVAIHNIAVKEIENNMTYALEMFEKCASFGYSHCYIGSGLIYKNSDSGHWNMTKAIESFEHALELEEYEAAVYLAEIYFTHKEVLNDTKAVHYLDQAIEKTDLPLPKLLLISRYLEDQTILESFVTCKRVYKLMKDIHKIGEINDWYYFGYQKFTMGRFDQALQLFSFASLNGHKMATLAAGYIWEHNLTETLTCRLGHHSLCAFVYNMQSFFFNDQEAGLRASRILSDLGQNMNITEGVEKQANKLGYKLLDHLSEKIPEAKFNKAFYLIQNDPGNMTEAFAIYDSMMLESWNGTIDRKNFAPAALSKYYHLANSYLS